MNHLRIVRENAGTDDRCLSYLLEPVAVPCVEPIVFLTGADADDDNPA